MMRRWIVLTLIFRYFRGPHAGWCRASAAALREEEDVAAISVSGELLLLPQLLPNPIVASSSREHLGRTSGERKEESDDEEEEAGGGAGGDGYDADAIDEYEWDEEGGEYDDEEVEEEVGDHAIDQDPTSEESVGQNVGSGGRSANYPSMTMNDMWDRAFDCERIFRTVRPVHNDSTWTFLRGVYVGVMMTASSATPPQHVTQPSPDDPHHGNSNICRSDQLLCDHGPTINLLAPLGSGFRKAVQARQTDDGKGRGVYAAEAIRKGELVWTATASTARFPSGALYRQFLAIIPADLACDVLQWAYVQDVAHFRDTTTAESGNNDLPNPCPNDNATGAIPPSPQQLQPDTSRRPVLRISVDLDEGSYMNGEDYDPNVGCLTKEEVDDGDDQESQPTRTPPSHCQQNFYALRDIRVGEELLCYYGDFATSDGWAEFGL
jgi:hypothetical protein